MTRERKIAVSVTLAGWILSGLLQAGGFIFSYGRLSQKVDDLSSQVQQLQKSFDPKPEVNLYEHNHMAPGHGVTGN